MKKILISAVLACMIGLWACQRDLLNTNLDLIDSIANDSAATTVGFSSLPSSIVNYVNANYYPLEIEWVYRSDNNGYEVVLEDGQELYFDLQGNFLGDQGDEDHTSEGHGHHGGGHHGSGQQGNGCAANCIAGDTIATSDLPQAVIDYVAENYDSLTIAVAVVKPSGKFAVELSDGTVLLFNTDGSFIKVCSGDDDGHGHHGQGHHGGGHHHGPGHGTNHCTLGDTLSTADLPQAASDYIAQNYPNDTIVVVVGKANGDFAVELSSGTVLIFEADGTFEHECGNHGGHGPGWGGTEITAAELPAAATAYIESNYPGETVVLAILTFHNKYFVKLSNNVKLLFDQDGNILFDSGN
ncbi:MAG: hypothetical protein KatS3mg030_529 [Saprospiraceae bacterium]|nr:MAG: hypothetical protein KatS3mg030_529 [Saprospiraceae bacterium]